MSHWRIVSEACGYRRGILSPYFILSVFTGYVSPDYSAEMIPCAPWDSK